MKSFLSTVRKGLGRLSNAPQQKPVNSINPRTETNNSDDGSNEQALLTSELSAPQVPQPPPTKYETAKRRKECREWWQLGVSIVTFIVVATYTVVSYGIWRVMITSNEQSRESFEVSQRAYVVLGNKDGKFAEFKKGGKPIVVLHFYNTGPSAAVDFMINISSNLSEPFTVSRPELNRYWGSYGGRIKKVGRNASIIAGQASHSEYLAQNFTPSEQQLMEIQKGKDFRVSDIYVYCDIFGRYSAEYFSIRYLPSPVDDFVTLAFPTALIVNQRSDPPTDTISGNTLTPLHRCKQPGVQ